MIGSVSSSYKEDKSDFIFFVLIVPQSVFSRSVGESRTEYDDNESFNLLCRMP